MYHGEYKVKVTYARTPNYGTVCDLLEFQEVWKEYVGEDHDEKTKETQLRQLVYVLGVPRNTWETGRKNVF